MTSRRAFIFGLGATLAVIRTPGLLMPVRKVIEVEPQIMPMTLSEMLMRLDEIRKAVEDSFVYGDGGVYISNRGVRHISIDELRA